MIRINRETDYGIVLMAHLARHHPKPFSASQLAQAQRLPLPMVSKILKALTKSGLLISQRGARGGYHLAHAPEAVSVVDVIDALEGPVALTECSVVDPRGCVHQPHCALSGHWHRLNEVVRTALAEVSLAELSHPVSTDDVTVARISVDSLRTPS
ncbi:MAG: SUF system Fe-S cluster assembly regulator [Candidatus Competibacterales bacterium]